MLKDMFGTEIISIIEQELLKSALAGFVSSAVPVLSQFSSAITAVGKWGIAAKSAYDEHSIKDHKYIIASGDPIKAFEALQTLMDRSTKYKVVAAGIQTTDAGVKALGMLADGGVMTGPAVGMATAVAKLFQQVEKIGRQYREKNAANELLRESNVHKLDYRLFNASPLMGCYMLCCATASDILNMSAVQFGNSGWMDDVEWLMKKHIRPVRVKAREFIDGTMFEIKGLNPHVKKAGLLPF